MNNFQKYKPAKSISEQIQYLNEKKRVQYNNMDKVSAGDKLLRFNYINIITPFKHKFAQLNDKKEVIKVDGNHVYENDVEFSEYYDLFVKERKTYPTIIDNIMYFELQFKSITAYYILNRYSIKNSEELTLFLDTLKLNFSLNSRYNEKRIAHMINHIEELKKTIFQYADVYCFFDRLSLGNMLTIYTCLETHIQNEIFSDLKSFNLNFNVNKVPDFIDKIFCLVSIRNCVMHGNSLEILIRFYNPKNHELRKNTDKKKYLNMINILSKEKTHEFS